jgi:hypothetical protein
VLAFALALLIAVPATAAVPGAVAQQPACEPSGAPGDYEQHGPYEVPPATWVPTTTVKEGQNIVVSATGYFRYKEHPFTEFGPNGNYYGRHSLKAKVGEQIVTVGSSGSFTAAKDGTLELGAPHNEKMGEGEEAGLDPNYKFCATVYLERLSPEQCTRVATARIGYQRPNAPDPVLVRGGRRVHLRDKHALCVGDQVESQGALLQIDLLDREWVFNVSPFSVLDVSDALARLIVLRSGEIGFSSKSPSGPGVATRNATITPKAPQGRAAAAADVSFSVYYDPLKRLTSVRTVTGSVEVDPAGAGTARTVEAGKALDVTANGVKKLSAAKAKARSAARKRVLTRIAKADACNLKVRGASVAPSGKNWKVTVKTNKGESTWKVAGRKVTPLNERAESIAENCA